MPKKGYVFAQIGPAVIFEPYEVKDGIPDFPGLDLLKDGVPFECHFFDREREYRVMFREGRGDIVEIVLSKDEEKDMDPDLIYVSKEMVKEEYLKRGNVPETLTIINRYGYSENDTLVLKNYRICYEEE